MPPLGGSKCCRKQDFVFQLPSKPSQIPLLTPLNDQTVQKYELALYGSMWLVQVCKPVLLNPNMQRLPESVISKSFQSYFNLVHEAQKQALRIYSLMDIKGQEEKNDLTQQLSCYELLFNKYIHCYIGKLQEV